MRKSYKRKRRPLYVITRPGDPTIETARDCLGEKCGYHIRMAGASLRDWPNGADNFPSARAKVEPTSSTGGGSDDLKINIGRVAASAVPARQSIKRTCVAIGAAVSDGTQRPAS